MCKTNDNALQKAEGARKELAVLDAKRSNVINIGLTVLPPPNTIKAAILKMDSAIMNREGIEVSYVFRYDLRDILFFSVQDKLKL